MPRHSLRRAGTLLCPLLLLFAACAPSGAEEAAEVVLTLPPAASVKPPVPTLLPAAAATPAPATTPAPSPTPAWPLKTFKYKPAGHITAHAVNLRAGPGIQYAVRKRAEHCAAVTMLAESGEWYYVSLDGAEGFVSKEFVKIGPPETPKPANKYADEDIYLAAQMVYLEAKGGTYEELQAIATVLANRIASRKFPSSIEGNIFAKGQFSVADNREWFRSQKPAKAAIRAAQSVLNDGARTLEKSVLYFRAKRLGTAWGSRTYVTTIGNHCFFS